MTVVRSGAATHVGRVRSVNQDLALQAANLFAVADGMGGHAGGEVAAQVAVTALQARFGREPTPAGLLRAVSEANEAVWRRSQSDAELRGMGTTLTAAALVVDADGRDVLVVANVGDSRGYLFSAGRLTQITMDHSLAEEKVRHGEMTEAQAAVHPHRHILTRALGVSDAVEADAWELHVQAGDKVILCSDGLTNEVATEQISTVLTSEPDPTAAARSLVALANEHGGNDNITVVVIDVLIGDGSEAATRVVPMGAARLLPSHPAEAASGDGPAGEVGGAVAPGGSSGTYDGKSDADVPPGSSSVDGPLANGTTGVMASVAAAGAPLLGHAAAGAAASGPAAALVDAPPVAPSSLPPSPTPSRGPAPRKKVSRRAARRERRRQLGVPRRITFRVLGFFLLLAGLVAGAYAFVRWYAMDNWYVTVRDSQVVIYQGRPGGLLWFEPKIVERTGVPVSQVLPIHLPALRANVQEPSLATARDYVRNLQNEYGTPTGTGSAGASTTAPTGAPAGSASTAPASPTSTVAAGSP